MGPNQNSTQPTMSGAPAQNFQNTAPIMPPTPTQTASPSTGAAEHKEGSVGALIGSIIIVIIIVLGGLYFWGKALEKKNTTPAPTSNEETSLAPNEAGNLTVSSESTTLTNLPPSNSLSALDEVAQIEAALADLESINSSSELATLGE